jgi:hypothetical protein
MDPILAPSILNMISYLKRGGEVAPSTNSIPPYIHTPYSDDDLVVSNYGVLVGDSLASSCSLARAIPYKYYSMQNSEPE